MYLLNQRGLVAQTLKRERKNQQIDFHSFDYKLKVWMIKQGEFPQYIRIC